MRNDYTRTFDQVSLSETKTKELREALLSPHREPVKKSAAPRSFVRRPWLFWWPLF